MSPEAPLRVLVVDDEAPARRKLLRLLREDGQVEVVAEADSGEGAVAAIAEHRPDLVLLDVQMPGMDGLDVTRALSAAHTPRIVFVTAHEEYAVRAFEVHAFDYLLKPVSRERFRDVLRRAREQRGQGGGALSARMRDLFAELRRARDFADRLLVHEAGRARFVPVRDIAWVEADRNYLVLHCRAGRHMLRGTLEALEKTLDPKDFVRINRSSVVRLDAIRELHPWFHGEHKVILQDDTELRWSRRYAGQRADLLKRF
jgi:two-component system, LytTR family, response regulator